MPFFCILSIFFSDRINFYDICVTFKIDLVSLFRLPLLSHLQVISCAIILFSSLKYSYNCCYCCCCCCCCSFFFNSLWVSYISVSRWSFNGVWVTTSLLKSLGLFSVFWSISIMQQFGLSRLSLFLLSFQIFVILKNLIFVDTSKVIQMSLIGLGDMDRRLHSIPGPNTTIPTKQFMVRLQFSEK